MCDMLNVDIGGGTQQFGFVFVVRNLFLAFCKFQSAAFWWFANDLFGGWLSGVGATIGGNSLLSSISNNVHIDNRHDVDNIKLF